MYTSYDRIHGPRDVIGITYTPSSLMYAAEDKPHMTARNSGLPCISVTWGVRDEELQRSMGTDYIIHKPEELLDVLDGRNRGEC